ncbi:5-formyltetrahydrofolate cyclo-ligase [Synechococcus lacustris L1E-Slac]|nr:5-formyltetrahydrofolate cyclo-ligase [Synechococcus lacustris L1F-Slac]MCP9814719.1 5-formyltetrahydrofolate cyclo-ligase [Synechococcus lacustris L1E-Slac]
MVSKVKASYRRRFRELRLNKFNAEYGKQKEQLLINAVIKTLSEFKSKQYLGIFWPLAGEPNLLALGQHWPGPLALPAVVAKSEREAACLSYLAWPPDGPLVEDACGIPAPAFHGALRPEEIALLLVPALAVDQSGIRLGYGGGWYDRLRQDPTWQQVPALVVLPQCCVVEQLPRDPWDVPFAGWITETGCQRLQP